MSEVVAKILQQNSQNFLLSSLTSGGVIVNVATSQFIFK
jgi:hypothetical protein